MAINFNEFFDKHEDVVITFYKFRPILATMNFTTPHITKIKDTVKDELSKIKVFSWTENKYRNIDLKTVKSLTPLASILKNEEVLR